MHRGWCGEKCSDCGKFCRLDEVIPCSPDCENLTENGYIKVQKCLESGCDEVRDVLDMEGTTDEEILQKYGPIAKYPY